MLSQKTKIIICVVVVFSAFGVGRFSAPTKVVTETKIVEVEKKTSESDTEKTKHQTTTTTETTKPDGTKETTTTTTEDSSSDHKTSSTDDKTTESDTKKVVENDSGKVSVSALVGFSLSLTPTPVYGGSVVSRVVGPFTAGIWGTSQPAAGVSIGLSF